ncbi:MAG TPA: LysR substrate-binding domain-containing protein [Acidimicrobiales bacterium]|nr:LysR substrate-binding domain-containing protein [Acidimicrobiales bacterium]
MDLRHLQAIVGIADTGSFSAAAAALGTVQSNVSAHVARLERELEVALVDRASGRLTEEGEVVVSRARRMIAELDAMVADVVAMRQEVRGRVRLGMIGTTGRWLVPRLFDALRARHPQIRLTVTDGTNTTLEVQLASGQLDLAAVTLPVHNDELTTFALFDEDLVLVVRATDPLARRDAPLPLDALAGIELLLPAPGTALRDEMDAAARAAGVELRPSMELDGLRMIASLTFDGHGPSILPATAVPAHLRREFRLLRIAGLPPRRVGVALPLRGAPSAPTRVVIELLHAIVQDPSVAPAGLHRATAPPTAPAPH